MKKCLLSLFLILSVSHAFSQARQRPDSRVYIVTKTNDTLYGKLKFRCIDDHSYYIHVRQKSFAGISKYKAEEIKEISCLKTSFVTEKDSSVWKVKPLTLPGTRKKVLVPVKINGAISLYSMPYQSKSFIYGIHSFSQVYCNYIGKEDGLAVEVNSKNFQSIIQTYFLSDPRFSGELKGNAFIHEGKFYLYKDIPALVMAYNEKCK